MIKDLQKRIDQIKQADRKPYHEMAYEMGISEYSLYKFMQGCYSSHTENKVREYTKTYKTKDEQIHSLSKEVDVLKMYIEQLENKIYRRKI